MFKSIGKFFEKNHMLFQAAAFFMAICGLFVLAVAFPAEKIRQYLTSFLIGAGIIFVIWAAGYRIVTGIAQYVGYLNRKAGKGVYEPKFMSSTPYSNEYSIKASDKCSKECSEDANEPSDNDKNRQEEQE